MAQQGQQQDPLGRSPDSISDGEASADTFRDIERTPEEHVRAVLKHEYVRFKKRGAMGADTAIDTIAKAAEKEIEGNTGRIMGAKGDVDAATRTIIGAYRKGNVIMGLSGKGYKIMDLTQYRASGLYKPGEDQKYIDYASLSPDVQYPDLLYYKHVCNHEHWHQKEQAKVFNAPLLKAEDNGVKKEFKIQPNLVEGQATAKNNQEDGDKVTPEYRQFQAEYREAAAMVGEKELDAAIKSGDILSLMEATTEA
jgi:hypothetical protein